MTALRLALAFGRPDVDAFLEEITHEQFAEWQAFASIEPFGWQAINIGITRLGYLTVQSQSSKRLKEGDFAVQMAGVRRPRRQYDPATERARWEAYAARSQRIFGSVNG